RHERFESSAEHLGVDRHLAPPVLLLAGGEAVRSEHLGEELSECFVGEPSARVAALEHRLAEQTAVEERDRAESSRGGGAAAHRRIEGGETAGEQHAAVG